MPNKKYYSLLSTEIVEGKDGKKNAIVMLDGRVGYDPVYKTITTKDGKEVANCEANVSVRNKVPNAKYIVKQLGGNEDELPVSTSKTGDEYVSIRLVGWDQIAERMAKAIHAGTVLAAVMGRASINENNGKTYIQVRVADFKIDHSVRSAENAGVTTPEPVAQEEPAGDDAPEFNLDGDDELPF